MTERIIDIAALFGKSLEWYFSDPRAQYRNSRLELYDQAAEILTRRSKFAEFLVSNLSKNPGNVLEIAAGSGLVSSVLHERLKNVTFLDLSLPALRVLKIRTQFPNVSTKVVNADFLHQPFPDKHFSDIVCVGGYRYVAPERKELFWNETVRILQDSGNLFFAQFRPRGFPINGTTLSDNLGDYGLQIKRKIGFNPKINLGQFVLETGSYEVVQYEKCSAEPSKNRARKK